MLDGKLTAPAGKNTGSLVYTAGSPFFVTVSAVDQYWNVTLSQQSSHSKCGDHRSLCRQRRVITRSIPEPQTFSAILVSAGVQTRHSLRRRQCEYLKQSHSGCRQRRTGLLVLLPGETRVQGKYQITSFGKTGMPISLLAGTDAWRLPSMVWILIYNTDLTDASDHV